MLTHASELLSGRVGSVNQKDRPLLKNINHRPTPPQMR